jgi:hypothetical protein
LSFWCFLWAAGPAGAELLAGLELLVGLELFAGEELLVGLELFAGEELLVGLELLAGVEVVAGEESLAEVVPRIKPRPPTSFGLLLLNVLKFRGGVGVRDPAL